MREFPSSSEVQAVLKDMQKGDRRATARCLRWVDDFPRLGREISYQLKASKRHAHTIGITGNPGAGKSTVVDGLIRYYRKKNLRVAVLAVDPSSPFSGGAILGDRIRMSEHSSDDAVYIRSLATRGALGGLSRSAFDSTRVLICAGFDVVIIETVGVGQDEVDIARLAATNVVIMVPGMGDDIQAIKAGLLEIADIFLINKADREGVPQLEKGLRQMLSLAPKSDRAMAAWETPIVQSVAARGEGIDTLCETIAKHQAFIQSPAGAAKRQMRQEELFSRLLDASLVELGRQHFSDAIAKARHRLASSDAYTEVHDIFANNTWAAAS